MKIAIIGSGAAGSVFAGYLKKGGADDITLIDLYKEHMDKIAKDGLDMKTPEGQFHMDGYKTALTAEGLGVMDILILMVKTTHTDSAMEGALGCIGPETVVCTLQNGLGNDEMLTKYVPSDRILLGCGNIGTVLLGPGSCEAKPADEENMYIGPMVGSELSEKAGRYLVDCFDKGGLQPKYYDDVRPRIWKKATSNSGFNTVCAALRLKIREVYETPSGVELVWNIWKEASDVAEALGVPGVWEYMQGEMEHVVNELGDYYPSMAQDTQAHRPTEVNTLTGAISMYGKKAGVPTPTCDVMTKVIEAIQANYEKQY